MNNIGIDEEEIISAYINDFLAKTKSDNISIDYTAIFFSSVKTNLILAISMWFAGLTVIGIFALYGIICFRGFTLGYSISCIVGTLGIKQGAIFILGTLLPQNIIFIPLIYALAISGIRLYKSIMKDSRKENIKLEILRHTLFSALLAIGLVVASFVEAYVSTNIFMLILKFL